MLSSHRKLKVFFCCCSIRIVRAVIEERVSEKLEDLRGEAAFRQSHRHKETGLAVSDLKEYLIKVHRLCGGSLSDKLLVCVRLCVCVSV